MEGSRKDLERASHVHQVEIGMQGKQDVNRLIAHCRPLRSHLEQTLYVGIDRTGCAIVVILNGLIKV